MPKSVEKSNKEKDEQGTEKLLKESPVQSSVVMDGVDLSSGRRSTAMHGREAYQASEAQIEGEVRPDAAAPAADNEPLIVENALPEEQIDESRQEVEELKEELEKLRQQANEYFDGWQRERADFSNYKRRIERDQVMQTQNITGAMVKKYLEVLDDLERALKNRPSQGSGATWAEGVDLIYRKLQNIVESEGLVRIQADAQMFDPTFHEAITHEDSPEHQSGQIIEVVQQGYMLGDRVLRPALVRVAR